MHLKCVIENTTLNYNRDSNCIHAPIRRHWRYIQKKKTLIITTICSISFCKSDHPFSIQRCMGIGFYKYLSSIQNIFYKYTFLAN